MSRKYRAANPEMIPFPVRLPGAKDRTERSVNLKDDRSKVVIDPASKKR
jgi:hypothetical protein